MTDDKTTVEMPRPKITERPASDRNGWAFLGLALALILLGAAAALAGVAGGAVIGSLLALAGLVVAAGLTPGAPNEARVPQLLGRYKGTVRNDGLRWVNPLTLRQKVSTRIRNHETGLAKVNDLDGNPIEISAVVVWQVADTARAVFEVDDFVEFVAFQTEAAVRAGVRAGDRAGDAAPPAGRRGRRGAAADRGGRGRHGAARPRPTGGGPRHRAGRGAQGGHGQQPAGRAVRRPRRPAGGELR